MFFHKNLITISIFAVIAPNLYADDPEQPIQKLEAINVQVHPLNQSAADFAVADHVLKHKDLAL